MIDKCKEWEDLFLTEDLLPESNVRIFTTIESKDINSVTSSGEAEGSNLSKIKYGNENPIQFATLEHNFWLLDGTFDYVDNADDVQYVSDVVSDENGDFDIFPYIEYSLGEVNQGLNAITIKWNPNTSDYAELFQVVKMGGLGSVIGNAKGNIGTTQVIGNELSETTYSKVRITFKQWSMPYRRARLTEIIDGIKLVLDKEQISSLKITKSADLLSGSLPTNTLSVDVLDLDNEYSPYTGKYRKFLNNTEWYIEAGYKINNVWEWAKIGQYYMAEIIRPQNGITATFNMENLFRKITGKFPKEVQGSYDNPIIDEYYWTTWRELYEKITKLSGVPIRVQGGYYLDDTGANYSTQRLFRTDIELLEWVQTVANASKSIIKVDNEVIIDTLINSDYSFKETTPITHFNLHNAYSYPEIEKFPIIKDCSITGYKVADDDLQYTFITNFNDNGVSQTATNERIRFRTPKTPTVGFATSFADGYNTWVYMFISEATRINGNARINPGVELYDLVTVQTKDNNLVKGYITSLEIEYTGSFKGKYTVYAPKGQNEG